MKSYQQFLAELKRRRVFRVAGIYGIVAFGVLQAADLMLPRLGLPDWTVTFMVALVVLAFPVVLIMAWAFEVTPEGVKRTDAAAPGEIEGLVSAPASQRWPAGLMALVGVVALIAGTWWIARRTAPEEAGETTTEAEAPAGVRFEMTDLADDTRPSIAVLPFADMSSTQDQEYFGDGMSEAILNVLTQGGSLRVAGRTSAFSYKGEDKDLRQIGTELGVTYLVEGSVAKEGDQVRITAQLINAVDNSHLWSDQYFRPLTNIFEVQSEISTAIADALKVSLGLNGASNLVTPTADFEAYDLFLAGRSRLRERGESLNQAIRLFEGAIERDSTWAPAWAGLAEAKELLSWYPNAWGIGPVPYDEIQAGFDPLQDESEAAARRALELDPNIAAAHVAMGSVHRNRKEWALGEAAYLRALALDPDNGEAHHQYADLLGQMGRISEAAVLAERALELDRLAVRHMTYAIILAADDRQDLARENARSGIAIDLDRQVLSLQRWFLELSILTGRFDSMFVYGSGMRSGDPTEEQKSAAIEALRTGDPASFPRVFFEDKDWTSLWMVFGQPDSAAVEFQRKVAVRPGQSSSWIWLSIYDPIREHPAYLEAMRALNLEGATPIRTPR